MNKWSEMWLRKPKPGEHCWFFDGKEVFDGIYGCDSFDEDIWDAASAYVVADVKDMTHWKLYCTPIPPTIK
jgi:hypothetical protein